MRRRRLHQADLRRSRTCDRATLLLPDLRAEGAGGRGYAGAAFAFRVNQALSTINPDVLTKDEGSTTFI